MHDVDLFVTLALDILITGLAWRYYRKRTYYNPNEKYLTFWPRVFAGTADNLVLWPASFFSALLPYSGWSVGATLAADAALALVPTVYSIALHARCGQTIGKRVCNVKVVHWKTEVPIGFGRAFLRDAAPLVLLLVPLVYESSKVNAGRLTVSELARPSLAEGLSAVSLWLISGAAAIWFAVEIATMLTNERRRALHDFIAGTVVVRTNMYDGSGLS